MTSSQPYDFDLFVIGAGSAGVRASRMAAALNKKVAVAEANYYGGTCVNVGCVPKKLFVYGSEFAQMTHEAKGYGFDMSIDKFDWNTLRDNKSKEIERLNGIYQKLLDNAGVTSIWGHAELVGANSIKVNDQIYTAEKILLATGGWPSKLSIPGSDLAINSNEFFYLDNPPKSAVVVGSGYIAVEFAGILNGLGVETYIASRSGKLLRGFDESTRQFAEKEILKKGITLIPSQPTAITEGSDGKLVEFEEQKAVKVDLVINATGRSPNIERLGLDTLNIKLDDKGYIKVSDQYETSAHNVFAMGDLIDTPQLTPVALAEAITFLQQQYHNNPSKLDYSNIATAVFCQPNLATIGVTEERAVEQGIDIQVYESEFRALKLTLTESQERTYMKLIVNKADDKVIGAHMVGEHSAEIMQGIAVAMKAGATKAVFDSTIGIHPSAAEEFVTMRTPRQ